MRIIAIRGRAALCLVLGLLAALGCVSSAAAQPRVQHCFVVSIDGCAPRFLPGYDIPSLRVLTEHGAWTLRARTEAPPLTLPATASMVSGLSIREHGIDWDTYAPTRGAIRAPTIFSEVHNAGGSTAMFVGYDRLGHLAAQGTLDVYECIGESDDLIMDAVNEDLFGHHRALYFIQLPQTEVAGRRFGWGSEQYRAAVENADHQIGRLLDAIADERLSTASAMIVTSDHGGHEFRHGDEIEEDMLIPWILGGPGVRPAYEIPERVYVQDTAPTVLTMMGIPVPEPWTGRVPPRVLDFP